MPVVFYYLVGLILVVSSVTYLHVWLCQKNNKIFGFILPVIFFMHSLLYASQALSFKLGVVVFIMMNIPTMILVPIYFVCKKNTAFKKTSNL